MTRKNAIPARSCFVSRDACFTCGAVRNGIKLRFYIYVIFAVFGRLALPDRELPGDEFVKLSQG